MLCVWMCAAEQIIVLSLLFYFPFLCVWRQNREKCWWSEELKRSLFVYDFIYFFSSMELEYAHSAWSSSEEKWKERKNVEQWKFMHKHHPFFSLYLHIIFALAENVLCVLFFYAIISLVFFERKRKIEASSNIALLSVMCPDRHWIKCVCLTAMAMYAGFASTNICVCDCGIG